MTPLRSILAANPGPFTLEGTRTHILGRHRVAVVDPGPDLPEHVRAVASAVAGAERVTILLTHGHADHAGAVESLLRELPGAEVAGSGHPAARPLSEGDRIGTDAGSVRVIATPGHTPDHLCFQWEEGRALFAGDMILGSGDTTWVAEYPGCVADWLRSLTRLEALPLDRVHPAHGPDLDDPGSAWRRFRAHRESRIAAVRRALSEDPGVAGDDLLDRIYGSGVPTGLRGAARRSLEALVDHVRAHPEASG